MTTKTWVLIVIINLITGCATSNEHFDCAYQAGIGCKSITAVNKLLDNQVSSKELHHRAVIIKPATRGSLTNTKPQVQRITEQRLAIWLAPYQDAAGDFHEGARIHTVLVPGGWQLEETPYVN